MHVAQIINQMKDIGILQISETTLKDWFSQRDYIHTTGAEIKAAAKDAGIKIKVCKTVIPIDLVPMKEIVDKQTPWIFKEEEIKELYIDKNLSLTEIAELKHCAVSTIYSTLRKYKLITKGRSNMRKIILNDFDKIVKMNREENMLIKDIAKIYGCNVSTMSRALKSKGYTALKRSRENGGAQNGRNNSNCNKDVFC